jgi:hypothetical protein
MKKIIIIGICLLPLLAVAQPGISEMQQAQQDLSASFFSAFDCALVIATILGTIGAVRIYHNWQTGRERIDAQVAGWFFAAIFMVLAGAFLRAIFGI